MIDFSADSDIGETPDVGGHKSPVGESGTPILDNFSRDLSSLAAKGQLDPVIGRDDEVKRIITRWAKRTVDGNVKRLTPDLFWIALGRYNQ